MQAMDTIYHGASREAAEAVERVKPPHVTWTAYNATIGYSTSTAQRVYKLVAHKITSGAICGPMGAAAVATVIFTANGEPVPHDEIARLERPGYDGGAHERWRMAGNSVNEIRDLLQALSVREMAYNSLRDEVWSLLDTMQKVEQSGSMAIHRRRLIETLQEAT
ncbi:MAG: hypothetical protein M3Q30_07760 [Actinomycetota bacterium]|nr:hypothetical protein [Actinomycetota bacterium]